MSFYEFLLTKIIKSGISSKDFEGAARKKLSRGLPLMLKRILQIQGRVGEGET
jgi:hypothetical protein